MASAADVLDRLEEEYLDLSQYIRTLSDEEVETFNENGWVFAPGFLKPELCEKIIERYQAWSGLRWREWPADPEEQRQFVETVDAFNKKPKGRFAIRQEDSWMFNYVTQRKLGETIARLLKTDSVRPLSESLQLKFPDVSGRGHGFGWHQDFPSMPIDRAEGAQFWLALVPVTLDMGPMVHLTGSHRSPPCGIAEGGDNLAEQYPEMFERYPVSEPHVYAQGDAIFHHCLTWHSSPPNKSDKVRWAMSSYRLSSRTRYTGQPNFNTDDLGMPKWSRFDHPNFPIVYP